jgi:sulfur carrier protein ThiS adenylyltransferase
MKIKVNESTVDVSDGDRLFTIRDRFKPDADIVILNGAPVNEDCAVKDSDSVVLIKRGEVPAQDALEVLMAARHTPGVHGQVKKATVGIAGCGGLGSSLAIALARVGVGRLIIADHDVVEPSNLNRQQYFTDQIGALKVQALAANLKRINPYITVEPHAVKLAPQNIVDIFSGVDVLAECFDAPEAKTMLVEKFAPAFPQKPVIMASGVAGHYPGKDIRVRKFGKNIYVVGDLVNAAGRGTGLMAPRVGIAAHQQANLILRLILNENIDEEAE